MTEHSTNILGWPNWATLRVHKPLGHISVDFIRALIRANTAQGPHNISLFSHSSDKTTCKPIAEECKAPPAKSLGDKVRYDATQHSGVIKSLNRRLLEHVRAIIHSAGFHKLFWAETSDSSLAINCS